jgi:hypothetical protein
MTIKEQNLLALERIKNKPYFRTQRMQVNNPHSKGVDSILVDKQRAIFEIENETPIGKYLIEAEMTSLWIEERVKKSS